MFSGLRLALCCTFAAPGLRFRTTTVRYMRTHRPTEARRRLNELSLLNAGALDAAVTRCAELDIRGFRIMSGLLPLATHPEYSYTVDDLPAPTIRRFAAAGARAADAGIRLTFHPDQFVILSSQGDSVTALSIAELELHGALCELLGADVINIHGGGAYGDKAAALGRVARNVERLSPAVRSRLTFENDDRVYTVRDLLPLCQQTGVPLVYDVHHHRCHGDGLSESEATRQAVATWNREPLFHISSPAGGWSAANPRKHADYIDLEDIPAPWRKLTATVDVEAKAKEAAVVSLRAQLAAAKTSGRKPILARRAFQRSTGKEPPEA